MFLWFMNGSEGIDLIMFENMKSHKKCQDTELQTGQDEVEF